MARKYDLISELYNRTCKTVVSNPQNWQAFLVSACRNYKLRYDEQLLVYAQRPDATAVLEIEQWNKIFGRWVNRGARGIAVFADENRSRQRLTHYFDISDTHESRYSRTVPIWDMRQEYEADVIETLESTFGEIENKSSLAEAIMGAARNAAEDNIPDYLQDLYYATEGSSFEEVEEDIVASIYKNVVANSVAYMMMSRLGIDTDGYFELDDFRDVTNFNTQETLNALGFATSDIAEMGLTEISKTITALNRQNRIIVGQDRNEYNKVENNDERSLDNERTDLHDGGRLQPSEPETSTAAGSDFGQIRSDEERFSEGTSQSPLLQSPDEGRTDTALGGSGTESQQDGGNNPEPDGTERGSERTDESGGYDEMGSSDELPSQLGTGNRESGSDIRLEYYDRTHEDKSLPFFGRDEVINEILRTTPHLSASLEEIKDYYERNPDNKDRTEYIKSIFNNDYTELTLEDGRIVGYKTFENVLHLWEGKYDSRTAQSFYDWAVIARHFEAMRLLGELSDSIKPLPSMDGQMTFILDGRAEEKKTSAFTFSQEIIDAVLANGSGFSEGKMRIYEQFEKSLSAKENVDFLKNEYGWGGSYPVIIGAGIDENHDGKGITITKGIGKENPHITLSWSQVEKRIGELIRMDRYLNPKEKEHYPQWLESQEERRAKIEETKRNREILSNAPPEQEVEKEPEEAELLQDVKYEYHLGDKVYIGASEYEILSVDDERVMLYDYDVPLFNKEFSRTEFDRKVRENPMNEHLMVKEEPAEERNETEEVQTNMGSMPIEDYREIVASQSGFDSYDEMYHQGYRIGNGYDKEPEPVVPAWEQKKKVKGFDLHPDVPMADRHTFNLRENEVETVGKKERFRRNIMAIQLLKKCQEENRFATPEEQIVLSKYVGWGGLSEAFDENNSAWATEYLELSSVLTPEEYASARESTLTAFYTPPEVITAIYKAMEQMGFKEGNLLEPSCGIGNFIGMLPDTMQDSKIYGVELDTISAGIAQQLYQKTTIAAQGFEETNLPDSFFDGVVGNVPFGDFKVSDKRYDKHKFLIHDYFFAKSLDKLRPGGVMALVTSKGTMDKETIAVRKYIAQRAELLGAIRLPNNTFKGNAGTEVVSDILILQKRDRLIDIEPDWVHLDTDESGIKMNSYFVQHPEMILGEMKMVSGRFGMEATCVPYENADLAAQLDEAVANIHGEITEYEAEEELEEEDNSIPSDPTVRNFSYTVVDDKIYYRENSRMTPVEVSATAENRIKGMIAIRNSVRTLIELQTEDYPDSEIKAEQERLNRLYDTFSGKYGLINSRANTSAFSQDSSFSLLSALEIIGEDGELERKKKAVLNKKETAIAQSKQEMIKQEFQDWIWSDPERRERLCKSYNEKFNSVRPREYDGSHIIFNGMNPEIELREHQKNAVAHILYGGNTLLAHAVGAGKTFEMVAAAQESKRLGLCNKSLFVVPNHLTEQWAAEYLQLYPAANILVATKKDFETKNRKKFCGRIATGDYDAVIIGHSQFEKIPMSIERQRAILEQQLEEITGGIAELKRNRGENFSIKQLEKSKKSIRQKLDKLNDQTKKDDVVTFEELGVDRLFVDESHYYKNLYLYTKMRNVGGIAQTEAQKSSDLFMKCRYLDEITGGRGTVFATGTPISNSMVELYTIQRYLQYNTLVKNGLQHFDAWASTFGETITAVELTPEGTGYRAKTRFAKFYNLPELMAMFKEIADIKTADMLNLPVPEAKYHNIAVKPSEMQKEMVASLAERAEQVRGGGVDSSVDNMLKITNDGRKLALDQRMLNDMLPDFEGSKINACVDNIYRIWKENADKKSAQLVFCDLSTPKNDGTFSVYNDIRKKLIERGIPESEVKFIHEADTDMKKKELFQKTRKGEVRVLLGSTQKMGAGTNVQDKLIALHDVDCPWRPSDLEQRSGRIVRQGNENPQVDIYRYVTEQTFDAYLYQLVEGKQKFASQIMTSKSPVRSAEDIDETALSYAEIKMLATGNPYIKEKMDLDIQVQKLKMLKSNFLSEKYGLEDKVIKFYPQQIAYLKSRVEGLTKDVETAKLHPKPIDEQPLGMMVSGVSYSEKAEAGQAIINTCKSMNSPDAIPLGEYRGFQMELYFDTVQRNYVVKLKGETSRDSTKVYRKS